MTFQLGSDIITICFLRLNYLTKDNTQTSNPGETGDTVRHAEAVPLNNQYPQCLTFGTRFKRHSPEHYFPFQMHAIGCACTVQ